MRLTNLLIPAALLLLAGCATKAQTGHDVNISEKDAADLVGKRVLERLDGQLESP